MGIMAGGVVTDGDVTMAEADPTGDDKLMLSGRSTEVLVARAMEPEPCCFSPGVSSLTGSMSVMLTAPGATGVSGDMGEPEEPRGRDTEAGEVTKFRGKGRCDDADKLLGLDAEPPESDEDPEPGCWSLGCARLIIRAHVATLMFI